MAATAQTAFSQNLALDLVAVLGQHFHFDGAVVEQHHVPNTDVVDEILVIHIHRTLFFTPFSAHGEGELLAGPQRQRHGQFAGPDCRSLGIHHDPDVALTPAGSATDVPYHASYPVMWGVRHVQAENIHPSL